ncbi:PREDICTED: dynamin-like protein ARC5 [Nicotiana attenuata]|uniref:dynamin-like protein ARC5 n=1 Tax=Nicotiana attenuata TaxID=49451 RepID=UPI000905711D|nr:PREDICTED: dynamin-like protein ARC5 [Nicotiana attenuata]
MAGEESSPESSTGSKKMDELEAQWRLYEEYNELHGLAQEFDAPTVLVVSRQTDGKSTLVELLMGFQFNHVGGIKNENKIRIKRLVVDLRLGVVHSLQLLKELLLERRKSLEKRKMPEIFFEVKRDSIVFECKES